MANSAGGSPLDRALAQVGDRWSLLLVHALLGGARRFGELSEAVPGIAPNTLSQRLKHLERVGIVVTEAYSSRPPRSVYGLTAAGRELAGVLHLLAQWASSGGGEGHGVDHVNCGTPLETRWWCPTCGRTVEDDEDEELRFL
jgi:DNA-binding HxlR family transcriptional regulator